ncbi:MAG: hypothetical protein PHF21_02940 [Bacilli bacterium]|nr:hypothetical protein [Bacilli bacterium]
MDKKVVRKNTSKTTPKKTSVKKVAKTDTRKKTPVKSKVVTKAPTKKVVKPKIETIICRFCNEKFEKGLSICPSCRKNQKDQTGVIVISTLLVLLLLSIIGTHFLDKYVNKPLTENEYKYNCTLASYEELVRSPKSLKDKDIKVIGKVLKVDGIDLKYGNEMTVSIDGNLFSGDTKQLITFKYLDKNYELGFIEGDIITVYGVYKQINGNIPFINAKYFTFGS